VWLLVCVYAFLAIAFFTGLHRHTSKGFCSLNGIDHYQPTQAVAEVVVPPCSFLARLAYTAPVLSAVEIEAARLEARAPPSLPISFSR
jgi:hypothetical protein